MNDDKVNKYMANVEKAIGRHLPESSPAATDIYNRCYEAVFMAIMEAEKPASTEKVIDVLNEVRKGKGKCDVT